MDKSYVSMEKKVCIVCGKPYDSGSILLDRRLKPSMERYTTTGWGMCDEHEKLKKRGYIALVGCDHDKSTVTDGNVKKPDDAYRTGKIVHIKIEAYKRIFNTPVPPMMIAFIDDRVIGMLEKAQGVS